MQRTALPRPAQAQTSSGWPPCLQIDAEGRALPLTTMHHAVCTHAQGGHSSIKVASGKAGRQAGWQAGRQADGQAGRQAGRRAGRQAGRQAGGQAGRQAQPCS